MSLYPLRLVWVGHTSETFTCIILFNVPEFSPPLITSSSFIWCISFIWCRCVYVEGKGNPKELCSFYSNNKFSTYVSPFLCLVNPTALEVTDFLGSSPLACSLLLYKGQGWNLTSVVHAHLYGSKDDMRETCTWDYIWHYIRHLKSNTSSQFLLKQYTSSQMIQGY